MQRRGIEASGLVFLAAEGRGNAQKALFRFLGDGAHPVIAHDTQHGFGIGNVNPAARARRSHDDVAGKQQANLRIFGERLMRERRITGAENNVRLHLDAELLMQRALDIYLRQYAEALVFQCVPDLCNRLFVRHVQARAKAIRTSHTCSSSRLLAPAQRMAPSKERGPVPRAVHLPPTFTICRYSYLSTGMEGMSRSDARVSRLVADSETHDIREAEVHAPLGCEAARENATRHAKCSQTPLS